MLSEGSDPANPPKQTFELFFFKCGVYTGWSISSAANFNGKIIRDESKYFTFQAHHRKEETFLHQIHVTEGHLKSLFQPQTTAEK